MSIDQIRWKWLLVEWGNKYLTVGYSFMELEDMQIKLYVVCSEFHCDLDLRKMRAFNEVNLPILCVVPECDKLWFVEWFAFINAIQDFHSMSKRIYHLYRTQCSVLGIMSLGGNRYVCQTHKMLALTCHNVAHYGSLPCLCKYWVIKIKKQCCLPASLHGRVCHQTHSTLMIKSG